MTGGYLPDSRRGVKEEGFMTTADWYATYAGLAGERVRGRKGKERKGVVEGRSTLHDFTLQHSTAQHSTAHNST